MIFEQTSNQIVLIKDMLLIAKRILNIVMIKKIRTHFPQIRAVNTKQD